VFSSPVTSVGNWFIASEFQHTNRLLKNQLVAGKQANAHCQESCHIISQRSSGEGVGVGVAGRESIKDRKQEGVALMPFNRHNGKQVNINGDHPGKIGGYSG